MTVLKVTEPERSNLEGVDQFNPDQERNNWQDVKTVMNLQIPQNVGKFLG
jgi:hypothetical protein